MSDTSKKPLHTTIKVEKYVFEKVKKSDVPINIPLEPLYFEEYNRRRVIGLFPQFLPYHERPYELKIVCITDTAIITTYLRTSSESLPFNICRLEEDKNKTQEEFLQDKVVRYLMDFFGQDVVTENEFKQKYYELTDSLLSITGIKKLSTTHDKAIEAAVQARIELENIEWKSPPVSYESEFRKIMGRILIATSSK